MEVENEINLTDPDRVRTLLSEPAPRGPIHMVNLLRFRDRAEYEDGRATELTGREAYARYAEVVSKLIGEYGGQVSFGGQVTFLTLGRVDDLWDEIVIATYPDRAALLQMGSSPEWQAANVHRTAGLAGQLNIETVLPAEAWARGLWQLADGEH